MVVIVISKSKLQLTLVHSMCCRAKNVVVIARILRQLLLVTARQLPDELENSVNVELSVNSRYFLRFSLNNNG